MAVNLRSMFLTCKQVIPAMLEQGGGSIVNTASISAYIGQEVDGRSSAVYNVTKAAARQLTTSLASRYAGDGIRVNAVAPGSTRTEIIRSWRPDYTEDDLDAFYADSAKATPLGRVAAPEELASAILFLASDEASFVTGASRAMRRRSSQARRCRSTVAFSPASCHCACRSLAPLGGPACSARCPAMLSRGY